MKSKFVRWLYFKRFRKLLDLRNQKKTGNILCVLHFKDGKMLNFWSKGFYLSIDASPFWFNVSWELTGNDKRIVFYEES